MSPEPSSDLPDLMSDPWVIETITRALQEDIREGDATTLALVPEDATVSARLLAKEACVVSGTAVAGKVFELLSPGAVTCCVLEPDGRRVTAGATILTLEGSARAILTGERTALNFMQRMTGIASLTRRFVDAVQEHDVVILDTRKTTPGLRCFEKYAVLCGGGCNHRMGLYDRVMIKDNHRQLWRGGDPEQLDLAIREARRCYPGLEIEVEVETDAELESALKAEPEWILLDNMTPEQMAACVTRIAGRSRTEASGGITLDRAAAVAASGVDAISLGCLTHSAPSIDLSLEVDVL